MFWTLLLAHFLGDYPLQPNWLVRAKTRWPGLLLHVLIHLITMIVLCGPAAPIVWRYLVGITLAHLAIDWTKNQAQRLWTQHLPLLYVVDQLLHYLTLALAVLLASRQPGLGRLPWLIPPGWATVATGYLVATYAWFISERILSQHQEGYYRAVLETFGPRMLVRAALLTVLLLGRAFIPTLPVGLAWAPAPLALFPLAFALSGSTVVCPPIYRPYCARAIFTDVAVAATMFIMIQVGGG